MQLLVLGANGLVGSNVISACTERGIDVYGAHHTERPELSVHSERLDIRFPEEVRAMIERVAPDIVVNCAAMTDVDECEKHPEQAYAVNAKAPANLADICAKRDIMIVHVSTDYVFNGKKATKYTEMNPPDPLQVYGYTKLSGEECVSQTKTDSLVVRISFVWGIHQSSNKLTGFPAWLREELSTESSIPLFSDQYVTPTRAGQAAETIVDLVQAQEVGLYHIACQSCITPYEFGGLLADSFEFSTSRIRKASISSVDRPADRPMYTCLSTKKVRKTLGRAQPTITDEIAGVKLGQ